MAKKKRVRVYQRGKTWTYSFETERINGKRKPITKGGFATEEEAYNAGMAALSDVLNGVVPKEPVNITYGDFLIHWLNNFYVHEVKPRSFKMIKYLCHRHLIPNLGHIRLTELSRVHIKNFLNIKTDEGYSKSYLNTMWATISRSLRSAITDYEYIDTNPAKDISLPKAALQNLPPAREALSKEQQAELISMLPPGSNEYIAVMLGLHCGLRVGEAMAITWDCIDFDNKTLDVDKQFSISDHMPYIDYPKYNSYRTITLDNHMVDMLKKLKKLRLEEKIKAQTYYDTLKYVDARNNRDLIAFDFIFRKDNGNIYTYYQLYRRIKKMTKGLSFPFTFHMLRHTHCTELIAAGAPLKAVQKRLGHKKIEISLNIYTSVSEEMEKELTGIMNNRLYAK